MPNIAPYGTWTSPISAAHAAAAAGGPGWVEAVGGELWWAESRPDEGGRVTVMRAVEGRPPAGVLASPWNARNRVHEYGGRPFAVCHGRLVFTHWDDQRLYRLELAGPAALDGTGGLAGAGGSEDRAGRADAKPAPITPEPQRPHGLRYACPVAAPGGEVWCIREAIIGDRPTDVRRDLVAVPLDGSGVADPDRVRALTSSHRFLTEPKISPDGRHAAWIGWNHPSMPWDGTELVVAEIGSLDRTRVLAGGPTEAVCQVEWDGPGSLLVLTDPDGWWNLYRITLDGGRRNLAPASKELGGPLWRPGTRWFAPLGGGLHAVLDAGRLAVLDESTATITAVATEFTSWGPYLTTPGVAVDSPAGTGQAARRLAGVAGGPHDELGVVTVELSTVDGVAGRAGPTMIAAASVAVFTTPRANPPDRAYLPVPVERTFTTADGAQVPALVYPPTNPDFTAPAGERPPYLVQVHGGPTGRSSTELDLQIALFTSRGIGVVAPNYGGSTGYGRAFRERLNGQWGVVDVTDCAAVAVALADEGAADRARLAIRGGSAGGWTAAASLTSVGVYRCGTVMFPILDLLSWTEDGGETHDLESHYLHSLIGPLPQARQRYLDRSPINHLDRLSVPVLLLQGLDDQICPPAQAERLAEALAGSGLPHAYLAFEGEQHGFRKAETIEAALDAELSFYGQVLGFEPAGVARLELSS